PAFLNNFKVTANMRLRRIIAGGDICPVELAKRFSHSCAFYNVYGPTETTVTSIEMMFKDGDLERLPIGKPISNTAVYILDKWLRLVPQGAVGELYIGGVGVARGYLNRPELTAEKFRPLITLMPQMSQIKTEMIKSFFGGKGAIFSKKAPCLYKTGDLGRWLHDGNIEFLGRMDYQAKIRGFRIELGEIENALYKHPAVNEAVVIAANNPNGEMNLYAYIVSSKNQEETNSENLKTYLAKTLPSYMVPPYFIFLEKIPLTTSGKVDRKALPQTQFGINDEQMDPLDKVEEYLVKTWAHVFSLEKKKIGRTANFFSLGGHSLKATVLLAKIHKELNVKIPLAELFKKPTVEGLARYIRGANFIISAKTIVCTPANGP
ncbi:MAG: non-ribosomal peptide synthetase, partial [Acidobacteria bacterium]|nr:non-ribosomal peptide synthetase [Acidobacteriota bacterium]